MKISIMGTRRTQITIPRFCIRLGSPSLKVNHSSPSYMTTTTTTDKKLSLAGAGPANKDGSVADGNRVMVVADSSLDAKGALQWALSHAVQSQDSIVLLHVVKPFNRKRSGKMNLKAQEILHSMKSICQMRRPEVQVEVAMVEGEKKGQAIVEEAKRRRASLLVLGQRRRSVLWRLVHRCVGEGSAAVGRSSTVSKTPAV